MKKSNFISPYIRLAYDSYIKDPWTLPERVIFDYEILYIKSGKAIITVEDTKYDGNTGDVFLFKPKQRHSIKLVGSECFHQPHLHFDLFCMPNSDKVKVSVKSLENISKDEMSLFREDDTASGHFMELPNKLEIRNIPYFEAVLFEIIHEFNSLNPFSEIVVKSLFLKLWAHILSENHAIKHPNIHLNIIDMKKIKEYIEYNSEQTITLDEISEHFNISKFYLSRLFKQTFGITPIHYSRIVKIKTAKELIQYSNLTLSQISERLNFNNINSFSRAFVNIENVPPSFYRINIKK